MLQYLKTLLELKRDEKGVTALEYGLIAALIAVAIITAVSSLGTQIAGTFTNIATTMQRDASGSKVTTGLK